jgi:hypothetical protein
MEREKEKRCRSEMVRISEEELERNNQAAGEIHRKLVHWSCFERTISYGLLMHGID